MSKAVSDRSISRPHCACFQPGAFLSGLIIVPHFSDSPESSLRLSSEMLTSGES